MRFLRLSLLTGLLALNSMGVFANGDIDSGSLYTYLNQQLMSGEVKTTRMLGPGGFNQQVKYVEHEGHGLFEGDIMVPLGEANPFNGRSSNSIVIDGFVWPNQTVPYYLGGVSNTVKADVRQAVADIEAISDIDFVELGSTSGAPYYINVVPSNGCSSYIGYRADFFGGDGFQNLWLADSCGVAAATHEFLHALGMFHEQSRSDRDNFVTIVTANIRPDTLFNFEKVTSGASDIGSYDYASIMHYPFWAFNINNDFTTATIVSKTSTPVSFYNFNLSSGDISSINRRYPPTEVERSFNMGGVLPLLLDD